MPAKLLTHRGEEVLMSGNTAGSVLFVDSNGLLSEDNSSLAFNDTTNVLSAQVGSLNGAPSGFANWQPIAATSGTDTTPASGTQFVTSIYIPVSMTITGVTYLIGSVGGTDRAYAVLYSSSGAALANSTLTSGGTTVGTAANVQALAFTSAYSAKGPGLYYVGISMNGTTARLRTVPAHCQAGIWGNTVSQSHGTVGAITPMTTFTADKAPVCFVYYTPS